MLPRSFTEVGREALEWVDGLTRLAYHPLEDVALVVLMMVGMVTLVGALLIHSVCLGQKLSFSLCVLALPLLGLLSLLGFIGQRNALHCAGGVGASLESCCQHRPFLREACVRRHDRLQLLRCVSAVHGRLGQSICVFGGALDSSSPFSMHLVVIFEVAHFAWRVFVGGDRGKTLRRAGVAPMVVNVFVGEYWHE